MKKLVTFIAAAILGVSMIGCAEHKPPAPTPKDAPAPEAKTDAPPAEPAAEEKK